MHDYTSMVLLLGSVVTYLSLVFITHAEFSKREANVVAHHLAKATCIYSSLFNEMNKFSFIKKKKNINLTKG